MGHLRDGRTMRLLEQRFDLIDAFIDGAQVHAASYHVTPALAQVTQAFAQVTAQHYVLVQIQPKALKLFQDGVMTDHIVTTFLAFQHRHFQCFHHSPVGS